jgi:hypothetical protein
MFRAFATYLRTDYGVLERNTLVCTSRPPDISPIPDQSFLAVQF